MGHGPKTFCLCKLRQCQLAWFLYTAFFPRPSRLIRPGDSLGKRLFRSNHVQVIGNGSSSTKIGGLGTRKTVDITQLWQYTKLGIRCLLFFSRYCCCYCCCCCCRWCRCCYCCCPCYPCFCCCCCCCFSLNACYCPCCSCFS